MAAADMTVAQAAVEVQKLRAELLGAVRGFSERTGLVVRAIDCSPYEVAFVGGVAQHVAAYDMRLDVRLP